MSLAYRLRPALDSDFAAILRLNELELTATSALDAARLARLHAQACMHQVAQASDRLLGFLLVLPAGCDYDSPNYRWFAERYDEFWYVDRIVVDPAARGSGVGAALYGQLIEQARQAGVPRLTCEFNVVPANAASEKFHRRFGFSEVAQQWIGGGAKCVSLRELALAAGR
ncbi:MAG: GNAT family N-acetyltransferase [Betaproteobacteria bacterium]|jgi:predicted GNAT superfamily acetyltransferase